MLEIDMGFVKFSEAKPSGNWPPDQKNIRGDINAGTVIDQ